MLVSLPAEEKELTMRKRALILIAGAALTAVGTVVLIAWDLVETDSLYPNYPNA